MLSQKEINTAWCHLYVESKMQHKWTQLQNRNRLTDIDDRLVVAKGEDGGRGEDWEFGISQCKLSYTGWRNKVLLKSTWNYIQYPVIRPQSKRIFKKNVYIKLSHFAVQQRLAHTVNQLHFNKNIKKERWGMKEQLRKLKSIIF